MEKGTVKWFNDSKGFGSIMDDRRITRLDIVGFYVSVLAAMFVIGDLISKWG